VRDLTDYSKLRRIADPRFRESCSSRRHGRSNAKAIAKRPSRFAAQGGFATNVSGAGSRAMVATVPGQAEKEES